MGKFTPKERRNLFYSGVTDEKGNIRLDRLNEAQELLREKEERIREGYGRLMIAKHGTGLLGIKLGECHIIAVFGFDIYVKCRDDIKKIGYDTVIDYLRNTRYVERV
jgi:hypothetical protein